MADARHELARSFDRVADAYRRARPSYPAAAVDWVLERAPGRRVVDLAAGTGKLTEVLLAAGADVIAIEPLENMRAALEQSLPGVPALAGTAEQMPLADDSADGLFVGQAFHWFDAPRALAEIARVLVPGGVLGLLWNVRDDAVAWVAELTEALHGAGDVLSAARAIGYEPISDSRFTRDERREFANPVQFDRARLVEWATSTSSIATLEPTRRDAALARIGRLADEHPDLRGKDTFTMPYVTAAVRAERVLRGRSG
jgi:ubiquinone/menaquinone biosynthesis C-methylase UbiE